MKKRLADRVNRTNKSICNDPRTPQYDPKGRLIKRRNSKRTIWNNAKPIAIIIISLSLLAALIYAPQYIIEEHRDNEFLFAPNSDAPLQLKKYLASNNHSDFDKDGLDNYEEKLCGSNPYISDSDLDGLLDGYDINPLEKNDNLYRAIQALGNSIKTPYEMNGVILWPTDKESWVSGAVIEVRDGYQFSNFNGWAKFPVGTYAFQYIDGKHTLLEYREDADAWRITKDCVVVLTDELKENTHLFTVFGWKFYIKGTFGECLANVLPDKGWITGCTMWLDDTFVDTQKNTYSEFVKVDVGNVSETRFGAYSNRLEDLAEVYQLIDEGYYVLASLMSPIHGECIVEVYGYTHAGDLIAAHPQDKSVSEVIKIDALSIRCLDANNSLSEYSYFEYSGFGFDSKEQCLIAFFKAGTK